MLTGHNSLFADRGNELRNRRLFPGFQRHKTRRVIIFKRNFSFDPIITKKFNFRDLSLNFREKTIPTPSFLFDYNANPKKALVSSETRLVSRT